MPFKPTHTEAPGPDEPHLALLVDSTGARLAIRPGASLWLVENKSQMDKIFPLTLRKVGAWNVAAGVGRYRCVVASRNLWPHRGGESDANAHLIAAAPDLLDALKWAHQHCTMLYGNGDAMVDAMSAAIARAEGKP